MNETEKQGVYQIGGSLVDGFGLKIYKETVEALLGIADRAFEADEDIDEKAREAYTAEAVEEIDFIAVSAAHQFIKLIKKYSQKQVI